ncbi:MAG: efflux RND transporter periplasmic adaptor subunit [Polaromonas sp.]|nr:efflux RND transporter periplasmic adaptor subunit [Polaromonas sp.]
MTYLKLKRKPFAMLLIATSLIITLAAVIFSSKSSAADDKKATQPKPALTVTTAQPSQMRLPIRLSANGNIAAWQEAIVGSESNGLRLTAVRVNVGDRVSKGQVLATFSIDSVQAEVLQSRASVLEAEANALDAAGNAAKARTLQASGALSEQQINQYLTLEKTAQARLEVARAALTVQQVRLKQTQLLAPDSGVISARTATVGAVVASGAELFRLIRGGRLEWRAEVTSAELGRIKAGTPATVVAANGAQVSGKTRTIGPTVDPLTRSALVYVDLPPMTTPAGRSEGPPLASPAPPGGSAVRGATSVGALLPGMFARGEFELGATDGLTIPQRAVVVRDGFNYVFRLGEGMRVSQIKVQTGRRTGDRLEIVSGLTPDMRIAIDGAGFLNDGDIVRINDKNESNVLPAQVNRAPVATK